MNPGDAGEPTASPGASSASRALALAAGAVGVAALAGWFLDIPVLKSFHAGFVSSKPNMNVGLLLVVAAFFLLDRLPGGIRARAAFSVCLAAVATLSIATIAEDLARTDFGIDQILFRERPGEPGTAVPGRPSPGGMVCLLASAASLFLHGIGRPAAGQWTALVPLLISYLSVLGYVMDADEFFSYGEFTDMSLPGTLAFLLLSPALLLARSGHGFMGLVTSGTAGGTLMRRLAPAAALLLLAIAALRHAGEQAGMFSTAYGVSLMMLAGTVALVGAVYVAARWLDRVDRERTESMVQLRSAMDRLRSVQEKMVEQARLRTMGEMASGIAHDLNNTLVPILGFSETLLERPRAMRNRRERTESLRAIRDAARDAANMVARLRRFYRPAGGEAGMKPHDVNRLVADAIVLTRPKWRSAARSEGRAIAVAPEAGEVPPVACSPDEIREVLVNLIINSVDAMPRGGRIVVSTRAEGDACAIEVRDDGEGMTPEVRERCMDPFFTTKGERGTGLGLAMAAMIARRHEGSLEIASGRGRGTAVTLRLPFGESKSGAPEPERDSAPAAGRKVRLRVLVVDDEPRIRRLLSGQLKRDGHRVTVAADGLAGLDAFRRGSYDLVITDRIMPGMGGDELAAAVRRLAPGCPIIMITGLEGPESGRVPADIVLAKPFGLRELRDAIRSVRAKPQS